MRQHIFWEWGQSTKQSEGIPARIADHMVSELLYFRLSFSKAFGAFSEQEGNKRLNRRAHVRACALPITGALGLIFIRYTSRRNLVSKSTKPSAPPPPPCPATNTQCPRARTAKPQTGPRLLSGLALFAPAQRFTQGHTADRLHACTRENFKCYTMSAFIYIIIIILKKKASTSSKDKFATKQQSAERSSANKWTW